jgi:hypothetical protein
MINIKRKKTISAAQFLEAFPARTDIDTKHKLLNKFIFIEDENGRYYLAESTRLSTKIVFTLLLPLMLIGVLVYAGVKGCLEVCGDSWAAMREPYRRIDECKPTQKSTALLKCYAGWYNGEDTL